MDEIIESDHLYAHLIDETLSFEQEIRETLGYPSSYCSAITVLTQAKYLTKWLALEEQCKLLNSIIKRKKKIHKNSIFLFSYDR